MRKLMIALLAGTALMPVAAHAGDCSNPTYQADVARFKQIVSRNKGIKSCSPEWIAGTRQLIALNDKIAGGYQGCTPSKTDGNVFLRGQIQACAAKQASTPSPQTQRSDPQNTPPQTQRRDPQNIPTPQTQHGKPVTEARNAPTTSAPRNITGAASPNPGNSSGGASSPGSLIPPATTAQSGHTGPGGAWVAAADKDANLRAWCDRTNTPEKIAVIGQAYWWNMCVSDADAARYRTDAQRDQIKRDLENPPKMGQLELAKARHKEALDHIVAARTAKGSDLLNLINAAEASFRNAAKFYEDAGDNADRDLAIAEAARMAAIWFVEMYSNKKPTKEVCKNTIQRFKGIDVSHQQSVNLVNQAKALCSTEKSS